MSATPSRRRFIAIAAAAAGFSACLAPGRSSAGASLVSWRGVALGADASLDIVGVERREGEALIGRVREELRRLEAMFSLYREDSVLCELNRAGVVEAPPPEFVELLELSRGFAELTQGAFDPTVQPLWNLYADHFTQERPDPAGPAPAAIAAAQAKVGYRRIILGKDRVVLPRGMSLTLNGVAQGYATDRVVALLKAHGVAHALVDMGESRAIGAHPSGRPWEAAIEDPAGRPAPRAVLPLVDKALATSGAYGFRFDPAGRFNHLFDPATGGCASLYQSLSVVGDDAATADALATAFSLMPLDMIGDIARKAPVDLVYVVDAAGGDVRIDA